MKISELISLLQQAQTKFGDMPVGAYSAEYCYELAKPEDLMDVSLRVMTSYFCSSADRLPGVDLLDESNVEPSMFLVLFYNDR
jgi:hypothetical protein